jgi:hypothetical protein
MKREISRLVLVFDANAGKLNAFVDSVKKVLMVSGCSLCAITHGLAGERNEWKNCKDEFGVPVDYLHRNEIPEALNKQIAGQLPCIVAEVEGEFILLLKPEVLERCRGSVADLKGRILYFMANKNLALPGEAGTATA